MEIHRIVLYVIDFDGIGAQAVKGELENARYANRCISPDVAEVQTRDIGQWHDGHFLNKRGSEAAREALFSDATDTAKAAS